MTNKIFVISFQRNGTTSTGEFFKKSGYKVADFWVSHRLNWSNKWFEGDFSSIFNSPEFINNEVFEDSPWWYTNFYKQLYHQFPTSRFVLMERDANKWFDSMVSHSNGKSLGNTYLHSYLYQRITEYNNSNIPKELIVWDNGLSLNEEHRTHYTDIYKNQNLEIKRFFNRHDSSRLITLRLEDSNKWDKLTSYFNINSSPTEDVWVGANPNK